MSVLDELFARCQFPDSEQIHCAVSGGPDSLAMLVLATKTGRRVTAYHVDHCLREGSHHEFSLVQQVCDRFGAASVSLKVRIAPGPNLEARARRARYDVLPNGVLTGHTADDQAETMLINLVRGAALDGLGAMRPESKPILHLRRHETHALCAALALTPVIDSTNTDPAFVRNRVRAELIPLMNKIAMRDVVPVLTRQAEFIRDDIDVLNESAQALDPTDVLALQRVKPALARRSLREWLRDAGGDERHPPSSAAVARVLNVVAGNAVACEIADGYEVRRHAQRLLLQKHR